MAQPIGRWSRVRLVVCGIVFLTLFGAVARRAYRLQVGDESERLRAMAEEQYLREIELPPRRGRILDRNGAELASTADVDSVYCNPRRFVDPRAAAEQLGRALGLDRRELAQKLAQKRYFAWVKRKVTPEEVHAVKALDLPGIGFTKEPRRFYPNRTLAATVMGHSGSDGHGLDGVELAQDRELRGQGSSVQGVRDALGRDLYVEGVGELASKPQAGNDVVLTIDRYLTFVTERAIGEAQARNHAKGIVAIVMDPRTGELLAMASVPTYNPNDPKSAAENHARDRAITDAFEPGSTMKTFTIAAALDAGVVHPDTMFDCMMGRMMVGKYTIHDTHAHGALSVAEVFKFSSNIGATRIARRMGRERLAEALNRFGFGHPTGVGLPGERGGIVRPVDKWGEIGFANISFGQGMTATPLQIVSGIAAIANGGMYNPPRIVARVARPDGSTASPDDRAPFRVISAKAAAQMAQIMVGVTQKGGTARAAALDGYAVAGKTGTAQKVSNGHYDPTRWLSSFVGFAPAFEPRVAVAVMVDEPQGGHLGGAVAAPIFKEIAEQALRYLHVPPSPELLATTKPGDGQGARESATDDGAADERVEGKSQGKDGAGSKESARGGRGARGKGGVLASAGADVGPIDADERPGSDIAFDEDELGDGPLADADGDGLDQDGDGIADGDGDASGAEDGAGRGRARRVIAIPDFRGLSVAAVLRAARASGVELALGDDGPVSGVAVAQQPLPGLARPGVVCRVAFGRPE